MICKPCNVAGDSIKIFRESPVVMHKPSFNEVAFSLHSLCKGCDCQHKIDFNGKAIQHDA